MEKKSLAFYSINYGSYLVIEDVTFENAEEKLLIHEVTRNFTEDKDIIGKTRKYKVYYTERKGSYFNYKGHRVYLNECIRY